MTTAIRTHPERLEDRHMIKCAHCKKYHEYVWEVRACGASENAARIFNVPVEMVRPPAIEVQETRPRRPHQIEKTATLQWCRCPALPHQKHVFNPDFCSPRDPVPPAQPASITLRENAKRDSVPAGRYAIEREGKIWFYRVSRPTEGRWAGRVFLDRQLGDEFVSVSQQTSRNMVLSIIAMDPAAASMAYGHHIGSCGVCGRALTNEESRTAGIGPICREKLGW